MTNENYSAPIGAAPTSSHPTDGQNPWFALLWVASVLFLILAAVLFGTGAPSYTDPAGNLILLGFGQAFATAGALGFILALASAAVRWNR